MTPARMTAISSVGANGQATKTLLAWRSVFVGAQHRHDTRRDLGIGRVGRAHLGRAVVAVDLPEVADAGFVDGAEIVLAVGW